MGALDEQFQNPETNRFWLFLKINLILRNTVDMAVGNVAYSWQDNFPEKVLRIQEPGSLPQALWQGQGNSSELSVSGLYPIHKCVVCVDIPGQLGEQLPSYQMGFFLAVLHNGIRDTAWHVWFRTI